MSDCVPVHELLERWRSGDQQAATELHQRYARRLWALAERQIGLQLRQRVGAEDVVQSVFRTFFRRTAAGEFAVDHSGSLWHLLAKITINKVRRQGERHHAGKRDVAKEIHGDGECLALQAVAHEPTVEEAAMLVEELESLLVGLESPEPEIVRMGLQGYSSTEIARQLGCSRWTVRRVLDRIGERLEQRLERESAH